MTTPTTKAGTTVTMPSWMLAALGIACTAAGVALGFVVAPLVRWLLSTVESAPGPLRLLAELPTGWAVLVAGLLGAAAGGYVVVEARKEAPVVTVAADHVQIDLDGRSRWFGRADVTAVLRDGRDLVLLAADGTEPLRVKVSDLPAGRLHDAFTGRGWPWREDPAYGSRFSVWVDGRPDLDATAHELLRARAVALTSKDAATAADLRGQLGARGVVVRERKGKQEVRMGP